MAFGPTFELSDVTGTNGFQINGELAGDFSGRSVSSAGNVNVVADQSAYTAIVARRLDLYKGPN